ncbi:TPA: hypothetical protein GXX44_08230, partial [bacterium]|nr:hypothetical protein [bacterium]
MSNSPFMLTAYDPLLRWDGNGKSIISNIAKSWQVTDNGKSFTFYLRKGIKWSDGKPFTAGSFIGGNDYLGEKSCYKHHPTPMEEIIQ